MGIQDFGTMDPNASLKQVIGELANLMDTLNFLLNGNLDVKNLRANSITADRLKADTITAREILANSITAEKLSVTQLSAISANLGTITAGIIYGAFIATANGTFPRVELSSVGNLITAYLNAANHVEIIPDFSGTPGFRLTNPTGTGFLTIGGALSLIATGLELDLGSTQTVFISAGTNLTVRSAAGTITDIVSTVNSKANSFSGYTGSFVSGTKTVNVSNGIITSVV
jgi:hypothetical protein